MSRSASSPRRTGRPRLTSREQILVAARQLIDRDGWEKLTIRRLAAELGIGATTLYHHVRDKEELLVLLLNDYVSRLDRPHLPSEPGDRVVAAATAMHDALRAWPWATEVLTTDGFVGRLDASALWMIETIVAGAMDHGCTPDQAIVVFRSVWYYTVGEILVRAHSRRRPDDGRFVPVGTVPSNIDPSQVPRLAAIGHRWAAVVAQDTYPQGLRALVDGLLAQATSAETRGPSSK
ncbi:TetR/AcrR family transcriptional regulator [Streptomyces sp. LX-29]|uniref:TetR/AcrR family transcriptional regulator n=1 Tax=Streptomyces sp. LX-29 TaxID=2900152 RepID=UPI00240D7E47|nr:TetR/AcrR family transcriptional regulator [Streptomyces sp. LX-29]WFB05777.1 TetR/AcrR family transcriptional regulator [Streptomyces sp. LX-29]